LPLSGSILELPHVAKVGCCRQAAVNSLSAAGFDPPALTPFTQLQRYAMHRA
jgi:hypothetical protein